MNIYSKMNILSEIWTLCECVNDVVVVERRVNDALDILGYMDVQDLDSMDL